MTPQGLSQKEATERLHTYGYNELPQHRDSWIARLGKKLRSPIALMIMLAALLAAILTLWEELIIICVLLVVNIGVDFIQESKALGALDALQRKLARKALVIRDGVYQSIDAKLLVPGDSIKLRIGDIVPADVRLVDGAYLQVDQSALTGESLPVEKAVDDEVYGNAIVKRGSMLAEVTATGKSSYFGKTAALVARAEEDDVSHFERAIRHIGQFLIVLSAIIIVLTLSIALWRGDPILETIHFALVLVIASIPVALPAVLSVTMAVGAVHISKLNAIVRNIAAIEELASVDVLCTDKTGTLTQNTMTLDEPKTYYDFSTQDLCAYALLASRREDHDPIEEPLFAYYKAHFSNDYFDAFTITSFTPFDPATKYTEAVGKRGEESISIIKGAPQVVLERTGDTALQERTRHDVHTLAQNGYRTLAVAARFNNDQYYTLLGLLPLFDPPYEDSHAVIARVREDGITIKMLTGDNRAIAKKMAQMLSIGDTIHDAQELRTGNTVREYAALSRIITQALYQRLQEHITEEEAHSFADRVAEEVRAQMNEVVLHDGFIQKHESDIIQLIEEADGFSEVLPEDKYTIVERLQSGGHIVAMTGDGVNDAPALQKADVGIAVSRATEAARAAADLVLLAPGLSVIHEAIRTARMTFERMKAYATFRIAETIRIILFLSLSIILFNSYPVTAIMIIMLALLNDIPVMMFAYDNAPVNDEVMHWDMKEVLTVSSVLGLAGVVSSFLLFYWLHSHMYPLALIQAMLFLKLDVAGHSTLYLTRTGKYHFWHKPFPSRAFFVPAFTTRILGTLVAVYGIFMEPVGWTFAVYIWLYALAWWLINDFIKVHTYAYLERRKDIKLRHNTA